MFTRVYMGMFISVLIAAISCWLIFQQSRSIRYEQYQTQALTGMVELISERYRSLPESNQPRFIDLVSQLTGANIRQTSLTQSSMNTQPDVAEGKLIQSTIQNQAVWLSPVTTDTQLEFRFPTLSERQFRGFTLLLVSELLRTTERPSLSNLQAYSPFALSIHRATDLNLDQQSLSRLQRNSVVVTYLGTQDRTFTIYAPINNGLVLALGPVDIFNPLPSSLMLSMLAITAIVIVLVSYTLVQRMESRLQVVVDFVNQIATGDLNNRATLSGKDQIAHLASRVNSMASQINELMASQKEMLQAISHDLRTPIARIRFRLDMLNDDLEQPNKQPNEAHPNTAEQKTNVEQKTEAIKKDIDELEALIAQVLTHLKLTQVSDIERRDCNFSLLLERLCEEQRMAFSHLELNFQNSASTDFNLRGDPLMLKRLMQNLVSNAGKHATAKVLVCLKLSNNSCQVEVHDDGEGIAEHERSKIFEPFYRIDTSRNKKTGGYGLGLSIIKRIAVLHHAEISVSESPLGGAMFVIQFPLIEATKLNHTSEQEIRAAHG